MIQHYNPKPANYSAGTARRLIEIKRRNEIQREANLPLLSVAKELRQMKKQEELEEFNRFEAVHSGTIWEEILKAQPRADGKRKLATALYGRHGPSKPSTQSSLGGFSVARKFRQLSQSAVATARRGYHSTLLRTPNNHFAK